MPPTSVPLDSALPPAPPRRASASAMCAPHPRRAERGVAAQNRRHTRAAAATSARAARPARFGMMRPKRGATSPSVSVDPAPCPPDGTRLPGATGTASLPPAVAYDGSQVTRRGASTGAPCLFFHLNNHKTSPFRCLPSHLRFQTLSRCLPLAHHHLHITDGTRMQTPPYPQLDSTIKNPKVRRSGRRVRLRARPSKSRFGLAASPCLSLARCAPRRT